MFGIEQIDRQIRERIKFAEVFKVYQEWKRKGLLEETSKFMGFLPTEIAEPLVYSFTTHVYKEKGLFVYLIGEHLGLEPDFTRAISLSADILWALSLIMDDIADRDLTRGDRDSCWVRFGEGKAKKSAYSALAKLVNYLADNCGRRVANRCLEYVEMGMNSLAEHKRMGLESPEGTVLRNYEQRCDFHGVFQVESALLASGEKDISIAARLISGIRHYYRGGQLINDLKDVVSGDLYDRSYSDIRNAVPTIPLLDMYANLGNPDKNNLRRMFGCKVLSHSDRREIFRMVSESRVAERAVRRIRDSYSIGIDLLGKVLDIDKLSWFQIWAAYKTNFLD